MSKIINNREDKIFDVVITVLTVASLLIAVYPLYFVLIASISDPEAVISGQVLLGPKGINFTGYKFIFQEARIWLGYRNTIIYTVLGTFFGVTVTMFAGYGLSRKDLIGRGWIMKIMVFTMFFQGGLIPSYINANNLGLVNTPWILILMGSVTVYNIIITKSFFQSTLPDELLEAAYIDGCGNLRFFISIAVPLSKAIIAVIALYLAIAQWNSYFTALIYITKKELFPLQIVLREILVQGQSLASVTDASELEALAERQKTAEVIKYGVIVVSSLPVISMYPFLQKYFVKGVMIGSVKG